MVRDPAQEVPASLRAMRREVGQATDPQILRIVATVESVTDRGRADDLISPLRNRLVQLRPPRRLRFARLMFHPLDPLIVPAGRWHLSDPTLPRSVLAPLATCVRTAMACAAAPIETAIDGKTTADTDLIARLGRTLWPAAAEILAHATPPSDWAGTGMTATHFHDLSRVVAALLRQAPAVDALCEATLDGLLPPVPDALHAVVRDVEKSREPALAMMLSLLSIRLPEAIAVVAQALVNGRAAKLHAALGQAADHLIKRMNDDGPEVWIASADPGDSAARVRRTHALLKQLEALKGSPARKDKCRALRMRLDAACKARFRSSLAHDLMEPLLAPQPVPMPVLEAAARRLRVLEIEARGITDGRLYDALLAAAVETLRSPAMAERVGLMDRARLMEIIGGADAAFALLQTGG